MKTCLQLEDHTYGQDQLTESVSASTEGAAENVQILKRMSLGALLYYVMFEADQHAGCGSLLQSDQATSELTTDSQRRERRK